MKSKTKYFNNPDSVRMKSCSKCREIKSLTHDYFHKSKYTKDGFRWECKDCVSLYDKERYKKNKALSPFKKFINKIKNYHENYRKSASKT